ncbi:hypothetical protein BH11PAT4_BH11PAT4_7190 [soil metagenome]
MSKSAIGNTGIAKFKEALDLEAWQLTQKRKFLRRCSILFKNAGYKDSKDATSTIETTDYSKDPKAESLGTIYIDCRDYNEALKWTGNIGKALERGFSQSPRDDYRYHNLTSDDLIKVIITRPEPPEPTD